MPDQNHRYHDELKALVDEYIDAVYACTHKMPKEEMFGVTSQLRRAVLSIALNYVEGFARGREKVRKNFFEISYGSLKESAYLIEFCVRQNYVTTENANSLLARADRIGAMLWGIINKLD